MNRATISSLISLARSGRPADTIRWLLRAGAALTLAFALLGNVSLAQQEDVHIKIDPRLRAAAVRSAAVEASAQQSQPAPSSQNQSPDAMLMLPPGATLPLGLTRPLSARSSSAKGVAVYLQVTFPVTVGSRMVIPPGAYVQGTIEKIARDRRANPDLTIQMSAASLIFSTGYTVPLTGTVRLVHVNARLTPAPATSNQEDQTVAAFTPVAGSPLNPAMSATSTPQDPLSPPASFKNFERNALIVMGTIIGVGAIVGVTLALRHRNDVYLETGTPLEITLSAPLMLDARNINTAVQQYSSQMAIGAPPQIVQPPPKPKTCYDPGSPGTPDTVIPGNPGTPPTVIPGVNGMPDTVIPGTPATPDTVIPGTPGTPGREYPCQ